MFLENCGCEYRVKCDLQPLLLILAELRRQLGAVCLTLAAALDWAEVNRQRPNVEYSHVRQSATLLPTIQTRACPQKSARSEPLNQKVPDGTSAKMGEL